MQKLKGNSIAPQTACKTMRGFGRVDKTMSQKKREVRKCQGCRSAQTMDE